MCSVVDAQWVTGIFAFLRIVRNTFHRRFHNALAVCSIFCKVQVCKMHCKLPGKVDNQQLLETAQIIGFIMLLMLVAFYARFGLVSCRAKLRP